MRRLLYNSVELICKENMLFGICNPMVDITVYVDLDYLGKYYLKKGASTRADERNIELFEDIITNHNHVCTLGGATLNVFRCFSWMLQNEGTNLPTFCGAIGEESGEIDEIGKFIIDHVQEDGVDGRWDIHPNQKSASCAVLIIEDEKGQIDRTLVANLGCSANYSTSHFESSEIQDLMEKADIFYFSGFFVTTNSEVLKKVVDYADSNEDKLFCINLSAEFVVREYWDEMKPIVLEKTDILFANDEEAGYFADMMGWEDIVGDTKATGIRITEEMNTPGKYVVFTQGYYPTCVSYMLEDGTVVSEEFPCASPDLNVIDTNGAGDSFVGGFLSQIAKEKSIEMAVKAGIFASHQIIQMNGVDFSIISSDEFDENWTFRTYEEFL